MSSGGGKGSSSYTTGYRYYLGMHFVIAHQVDGMSAIMVGDKIAWTGDISNGQLNINQYSLFGGDSSEGGIGGTIDVMDGNSSQEANTYLATAAPSPQPAYRGVFSLVLRYFQIASVNPYLKPWKMLVYRYSTWYSTYAKPLGTQVRYDTNSSSSTYHQWITTTNVVTGLNPIHIIWEVLTSSGGTAQWGLGFSTSLIDETSFQTAAQTCFSEGLGLNAVWSSDTSAEDFLNDILSYIDGILFVNPKTGCWTIKLFRGGYDESSLAKVDESSIIELTTFKRTAYSELVNQVVVKWVQTNEVDGDSETDRTVIVQNLANKAIQGGTISKTIDCPYITNSSVAQKVAERYLKQLSFPLATLEVVVNRTMYDVTPGDAIVFSWNDLGIVDMCFRVMKVNYGELEDGKITLSCTEDIYGVGYTTFTNIGVSGWNNIDIEPVDSDYKHLEEVPYYIIVNNYYSEDSIGNLDPLSGIMMCYVAKPSSVSLNYKLYEYSSADSQYEEIDSSTFTPTGTLSSDITAVSTSLIIENIIDISLIISGSKGLAQIDNEFVLVTDITYSDNTSTEATIAIARGVLDTTPTSHLSGSRIWFIDMGLYGISTTQYLSSETINLKACPSTSKGSIELSSTSALTKTFAGRMIRPYPPANVKINGTYFPSSLDDDSAITVSWDNRNRLTQTGYVVQQFAGNIVAEDNTTITIYFYDGDTETLLRTYTGLASTLRTYVYPLSDELNDRGPLYGNSLHVSVCAIRDGYQSWQNFNVVTPTRIMSNGVMVDEDGNYIVDENGNYIGY